MKKIVLTFGILSGLIVSVLMVLTIPLHDQGVLNYDNGMVVGYTTMFLAFLLVFFGIRSYRDNVSGGNVTFGRAFRVGILITLITCAMYVGTWQVYSRLYARDYMEKYAAHVVKKQRDAGASAAEIAKTEQEMADFQKLYANPFFNVAVTFLEIFPVGLVITLVSAAILRRKPSDDAGVAATSLA
jgi:hypothetical protein